MDRQNFIEDSDIKCMITPESSVPTFVHNYRIKGYKVNTVWGLQKLQDKLQV